MRMCQRPVQMDEPWSRGTRTRQPIVAILTRYWILLTSRAHENVIVVGRDDDVRRQIAQLAMGVGWLKEFLRYCRANGLFKEVATVVGHYRIKQVQDVVAKI